jgi:hypothetical protein
VFFKLAKSDDRIATYVTERKGEGQTEMSFTMEQAKNAGLGGDNWRKYPAAMLRARASLALARAVYPDLMLGVYDPDEVPAEPPARLHVAPPAPKTVNEQPAPKVEAKPAKVEPEDAQIVEAEPTPAEALGAIVNPEPTPAEQALIAIAEAQTLADLQGLTGKITSLGVSKDPAVRKAYGDRQNELRAAHAS